MAGLVRYEFTGEFTPSQLLIIVYGKEKTGKSSFACSFPDPLFIANLDHDINYLLEQNCVDKEVWLDNIWPSSPLISSAEVSSLVSRVDMVAAKALASKKGTFIIDGGSKFYNYLQVHYLGASFAAGRPRGGEETGSQLDWGLIYQHITQLLQPFQTTGTNVVITFEAKKEYRQVTSARSGKLTGEPTGGLVPRGPEPIGYTAHAQLRTFTQTRMEPIRAGAVTLQECEWCGQSLGRGQHTEYWGTFNWTAYRDSVLRGRDICGLTYDKVKALLSFKGAAQAEAVLAPVEQEELIDLSKLEKGEE